MGTNLVYMKGEEFIKKVLEGERDFSGIEFEKGFNLDDCDGFNDLNKYLQVMNFFPDEFTPLIINGSRWQGVKARGLHLSYVRGKGADLRWAYFLGADLGGANLGEADLREVINLGNTIYLKNAIFYKTKVTAKEKSIIEEALKNKKQFIIFK